jgi:hypothetical protein
MTAPGTAVARVLVVAAGGVSGVAFGAGKLVHFGERLAGEVAGCVVEGYGAKQELLRVADFQVAQKAL